ncbi:ArsR/SmtB family transcription factor, partial [Tsukamurella pulmonis]
PADRLATVLGALGHPARIEIVQELLRGPRTAAELVERADGGSKGQLYHHLSTLTAAGVVDKGARGQYAVAPQKVVPALVALLTAADIGGLLR